ncbi:MAG TPA: hypothetical protein PLX45_03215 [Piscinibacter sp.]|jgi:hypothetical protein|uniref:hypothetical protein n=1 Tax=Piscinibacter sp. TaxID=1903157 RepID=UPI001B687666|nr:hypothetical protein [Piscinibacter sp.]MBK7532458.1 hypothetical protein [Piscinibacter sp.]MBP6541549.1 hypothetical protein [Piscinibacter sp.]HOY33716.1 hypothetical protein [Piscinibacter sp.]HPG77143.1 hypothetical protein [Piscinibacter sp.]HPM65232.1 hypothetical protein [Piscinibacter sp.]
MEREGANEANIMIRVLSVVLSISAAPALAADKPARPIEDGAKQIAGVWQFPEYIASCLKIDAIRNKGLADLRLIREFDKALGWVGPALGLTEAAAAAAQGRDLDALQKIGAVGIDQAICTTKPMLCPAWAVGRSAGEVINYLVSKVGANGKDATELFEDFYIQRLEAPATARELLKLQAALEAAKARRERTLRDALSCPNPGQTPQGDDALLGASRRLKEGEAVRPPKMPGSSPPTATCEVLKDTAASERLSAIDPDGYDALLARCL